MIKHVLATVVHVEGSSYRKPGARMLIAEDGLVYGAISGGCLEDDVRRKAAAVMMNEESRLIRYETTDDNEISDGLKLGCNGTIYILLEPITPAKSIPLVGLLRQAARSTKPCALVVHFSLKNLTDPQVGTYALLLDNTLDTIKGIDQRQGIELNNYMQELSSVLAEKQSKLLDIPLPQGTGQLFVQYLQPVIHLLVIGSGYDVIPLIKMTKLLGWDYQVLNKRSSTPSHGHFHIRGMSALDISSHLKSIDHLSRTAVVLLSHNYSFDKAVLASIIDLDLPYIGMLGPRSKFEKMQRELIAEGRVFTKEQRTKIHSPIGLDIGSNDADEIAVAIVSEIMMMLSK